VIDTDMSSFVRSNEGRDTTLGMRALQRIGHPDDVADVVSFLAADGWPATPSRSVAAPKSEGRTAAATPPLAVPARSTRQCESGFIGRSK
jgi:NAD(P)-dependent dehydrogenase (short-subunit alcohol dehydrogenase family)